MSLDRLSREFEKILKSRDFTNLAGKETIDVIVKRVKSGFGVTNDRVRNPRKKRLKKLTPLYIEVRHKKANRLGRFGSPGRSNLTATGQMLDNLSFKRTTKGIEVFVKRNERRFELTSNRSRLTNREVADFAGEKRPFFALTSGEQRIIFNELNKFIQKRLDLLF